MDCPDGFTPMERTGGFEKWVSPLFDRKINEFHEYTFKVEEDHGNSGGSIHGGILMLSVDHIMAMEILRREDRPERIATIQLDSQFLSRARPGDWLIAKPEILQRTRDVIFMACGLYRGETHLFQANGIWKIIR